MIDDRTDTGDSNGDQYDVRHRSDRDHREDVAAPQPLPEKAGVLGADHREQRKAQVRNPRHADADH